jgi:nucleoside-diphosphate-sugar epimerase
MATTYCITGISGYIGKLLAKKLAQEAGNHVIGIDLEAPADLANVKFCKNDIRDAAIGDIFKSEDE